MKHLIYLFLVAAGLTLAGCEKNALVIPADPAPAGARLKLINAAPDLAGGIELAINGRKFSAYTPNGASTTNVGFPVGLPFNNTFPSTGSNYAITPSGTSSLSLTSPATSTATSATAIGQLPATLDETGYYSLFVAGTGTQTDLLLLKDNFNQATASSQFYVRFVNLIPNAPTSYDLLLADGKTVLARNIGYKGFTDFAGFDVALGTSFVLRASGTSTNVATVTFSGLGNGRVLTIYTRGVFGRTGAAAPGINVYVNR